MCAEPPTYYIENLVNYFKLHLYKYYESTEVELLKLLILKIIFKTC